MTDYQRPNDVSAWDEYFYVNDAGVSGLWMRTRHEELEYRITKDNALEISIAGWKWAKRWMALNEKFLCKGSQSCALCFVSRGDCEDCVIFSDVHVGGCGLTPYDKYRELQTYGKKSDLEEALSICDEEIAYLESLMPKERRPE